MNVCFDNIVGNDALKSRISRDVCEGTVSHAYIIEGPEGVGRHTLAKSIAAALSCTSDGQVPCGRCRYCQKIFSDNSPDVKVIGFIDDKVTIGVDQIREIKEDMATFPGELSVKVYIIENAESLTVQAQNSFLLSLEEPPEYVRFFLICESANSLLETVRSRAPSLRMSRLGFDEVEDYVLKNDSRARTLAEEEPETFKTVIHASDGRIGRARTLLGGRERKAMLEERRIAESVISLLASPNRTETMEIVSTLGIKRASVIKYLTAVECAIRDLILLKKSENVSLCFYTDKESAQEIATRFTSKSLISLYDAISDAVSELEANSNVRLTVLNMMQRSGLI